LRRLPGILLTTCATIIVIVALAISGLRLALPQLHRFQDQLVSKIESLTGVPIELDQISGSWKTFGPTLELKNLSVTLPDTSVKAERVTLALDVWQSLLHFRWQFRDLTFYNLDLDTNATFRSGNLRRQTGKSANRAALQPRAVRRRHDVITRPA